MVLMARFARKFKQFLYRLGWIQPFVAIERHRYLRRLKRSRVVDSRYLSLHDREQFVGEEIVVRVDHCGVGTYFHCHPRSSVEGMLLQYGFFQKAVFDTLAAYVQPGAIAIDVGANIGAIALPLARTFPDLHVHGFEPNPLMIRRFEQNVALNRMSGRNLSLRPLALSDAPGRTTLFAVDQLEGNPGLSSMREDAVSSERHRAIEVEVDTLDALYLDSPQPVCAIKLDVQGFELQVLRGGRKLLEKFRPALVFEHEDALFENSEEAAQVKAAMRDYLHGLGYRGFYISRYGADLLAPVVWEQPLNGDVLAVHAP